MERKIKAILDIIENLAILFIPVLLLFGLLSLFAKSSHAYELLSLDELALKYRSFVSPGRSALIYPEPLKDGVDLRLNTTFFDYFYWNSTVASLTSPAKYEAVSLTTEVGVRLSNSLSFFYEHMSAHILDRPHAFLPKFPVNDSVGINLIIYSAGKPREGIF